MAHFSRSLRVVEDNTHKFAGRSLSSQQRRGVRPSTGRTEPRVLVVDDDPLLRKLVVSRLTADGFEVVQARGGVEALEYLDDAAEQPDLILLDAGMPELDGFEVLRQLSSDPKRSSIPVIMLTARRGRADVVAGLSNGARDYLTKPIMADDLMARVNWLFGNLA